VYVEAEHAIHGVITSLLGGLIWRISLQVSGDAALGVGTVRAPVWSSCEWA